MAFNDSTPRPPEFGLFGTATTQPIKRALEKTEQEAPTSSADTCGVNAKKGTKRKPRKTITNPQQAGVIANFHAGHENRVVAISELHQDLDHEQIRERPNLLQRRRRK